MPGSRESGAVPDTSVMLPPVFGAPEVVDDDADELDDELPHAASATTEASARTVVRTALVFLLIVLLLRGRCRAEI
jgi:hypothetical protein